MQNTDDFGLNELYRAIQLVISQLTADAGVDAPELVIERPRQEKHGDFATNIAMLLAPVLRKAPRDVATMIVERLQSVEFISELEIAGPGFINITLSDTWFLKVANQALIQRAAFGSNSTSDPETINVEYVSANPTGPIVAASARHAAYGDSLARILKHVGHNVSTEYYVNDAGRQIELLGASMAARAKGEDVPEGGYEGEYVKELAVQLNVTGTEPADELGAAGVDAMLSEMKASLQRLDANFDRFQSERELHSRGEVEAGVRALQELGRTYEEDGAVMFRSTDYGDDKDRALLRSNGAPTYFAADVAYMKDKFSRVGANGRLIYVLGADHHGYIARLKAVASGFGKDPERCEVPIIQMVSLIESGEKKQMSKRRGDFVTADELLDRIGTDATRYFMLQRSQDQPVDIDLDLAEERNDSNPVFYVQYAHARLASIQRKAAEEGLKLTDNALHKSEYSEELHVSERRLLKRISEFESTVALAAERRQPHRIAHYAYDIASDVSKFYRDCRVTGDGIAADITQRRLAICEAAKSVLALSLSLIGVSAPDKM